jgi:signal transduction histidine kinase
VIAAVVDDRGLPDQRRFRLVLVALLGIAALVGTSPPTPARTVLYVAVLVLACGGWLAWTLLPDSEGLAQAGLALAAIAGAALLAPAGRSAAGVAAAFAVISVSAAVHRLSARRALLVGLGAVVVFAATAPIVGYRLAFFCIGAVAIGVPAGLVQREHRRRTEQAEMLLAEAQRTREEQARAAALAERLRLARDLHDVLAHTLAGLAIQLETAEALLVDADDRDRALDVVRRSRGLVVEGIDETRRAVSALRGDEPTVEHGLAALADAATGQGAEVSLAITGDAGRLSSDAQLALVRIAREALTNARRHAPASVVEMRLAVGRDAVLTVRNAVSSDIAAGAAGHGITGMAERAALVGGRLETSREGGAFTVRATVPA